MKIIADHAICEHHGLCFVVDAELFPLDDEGKIAIGEGGVEVPEGKEDLAREGVSQCPVLALQIEE
jgi:ferredoxin